MKRRTKRLLSCKAEKALKAHARYYAYDFNLLNPEVSWSGARQAFLSGVYSFFHGVERDGCMGEEDAAGWDAAYEYEYGCTD